VIELGENSYGKRAIRLVKVIRDDGGHRIRDLTVDVALRGTSRPPTPPATTR